MKVCHEKGKKTFLKVSDLINHGPAYIGVAVPELVDMRQISLLVNVKAGEEAEAVLHPAMAKN